MPVSISGNTFDMPACALCCQTGTGSGCDCVCCPNGVWSEYTFTIADLAPALFGPASDCDGYNGTWTLKYRGTRIFGTSTACVWSTDEVIDGVLCEGDVVLHPFDLTPERWILYCYAGVWTLINAGTTTAWTFDGAGTSVDFCVDGGLMLYTFADTSNCCKWDGFAVYPTETHYLSVSPTGVFYPC